MFFCPVNCKSVFHNQLHHYIDFLEVCINWRKTGSYMNGKLGLSTSFSMFEWLELSGVVEVYIYGGTSRQINFRLFFQ